MSTTIQEALQEQRDRAKRLAEFATEQVEIYDDALERVSNLATKYGFGDEDAEPSTPTKPRSSSSSNGSRRTSPRRQSSGGSTLSVKSLKDAENKSQAIKACFAENPDAMPKDVIATCKSAGWEVSVGLVSSIKTKLKQGGSSSSTGSSSRGKKSGKSKLAAAQDRGKSTDLPLPAIVQEVLGTNKGGLKLDELVLKCLEAGYVYTGKAKKGTPKWRKAVSQNVYQCCNDLMKSKNRRGWQNEEPIVVRDETSHRYKLNPKAKKAA